MKIKTKLLIMSLLPMLLFIVTALSLYSTNREMSRSEEMDKTAERIRRTVFELNSVINQYLLHSEERPKVQFRAISKALRDSLTKIRTDTEDQEKMVQSISSGQKELVRLYSLLVDATEKRTSGKDDSILVELREKAIGQILRRSSEMVTDSVQLSAINAGRMSTARRKGMVMVFAAILISGLATVIFLFLLGKGILKPIRRLQDGAAAISAGDLHHRIPVLVRDEMGELSEAFNGMTARLSTSYASLDDLQRTEKTLRREHDFTAAVLDNTGSLVVVLDREGRITRFNRACEAITGYASEEVSGRLFWEFLVPPDELPGVKEQWDALSAGDFPNQHENHWTAKDGSRHLITWSNTAITTLQGDVEYIIGTGMDITERKIREERITRLTKLYGVLSRVNEMIVRTRDEGLLYKGVCRIVAEEGEFPLVWVGRLQERQVAPAAWHGQAAEYLKEIKVEVEGELGNGPTGTCIREDRPVVNDDFDVNPSTAPWREPALRYGFRASAAFPVHRQGQVVGSLTLYAAEPGVFDAEEVDLLEALCADISYALDAMQKEKLRAEAENALRQRTLELQQLTETLEQRVQKRTAALAKANEALRDLSARLLSAQEEERKRIAGDLHDTIGSCLAGVKFKVEMTLDQIGKGPNAVTESLNTIIPLVQEGIEECRRMQQDLRPSMLDDLGLLPALSWFCRRFQAIYSGIRIEQEMAIQEDDIPQMLKIVVFRVTQEAMNNIAKHSKADLVRFSLRKRDDRMELVLQDNGRGFSLEKINSQRATVKGLGLTSMRERAGLSGGSFDIESVEGKGTIIRASWPFANA